MVQRVGGRARCSQADWQLGRLDLPFLTIAVQLGFAAGALILAASGAADVMPGR